METGKFTPHARGSTFDKNPFFFAILVYPACAGIDPTRKARTPRGTRLPRMRGDRPTDNYGLWGRVKFTPHARGSTVGIYLVPNSLLVYPACAGIDLRQWFLDLFDKGLPRMRGDRP